MREAVAHYVAEIHRAYIAQAMTFPAAVRGGMPLLAPGPLTVAAVGVRNLHLLATRDSLGPVRGPGGGRGTVLDAAVLRSGGAAVAGAGRRVVRARLCRGTARARGDDGGVSLRGLPRFRAVRAQRGARGYRAGGRALGGGAGLRD